MYTVGLKSSVLWWVIDKTDLKSACCWHIPKPPGIPVFPGIRKMLFTVSVLQGNSQEQLTNPLAQDIKGTQQSFGCWKSPSQHILISYCSVHLVSGYHRELIANIFPCFPLSEGRVKFGLSLNDQTMKDLRVMLRTSDFCAQRGQAGTFPTTETMGHI